MERKNIMFLFFLVCGFVFSQQEKNIDEVVIKAVKKGISYEGNKMILNIDNNPIYDNTTVIDALKYIPKLSVDDGKIMVNGKSKVLVLIDGRESSIPVENIPTKNVKKIEIINNSSKYDAKYDAVVNVILDKWENRGIKANILYNTTISNKKVSNFGTNDFVYNKGKFSINFNYSMNLVNNKFIDNSYQEMERYDYYLNNLSNASRRVNYWGLNSNYSITDNQNIGIDIGYTNLSHNTPTIGQQNFHNKNGIIDSMTTLNRRREEEGSDVIGTLYYKQKNDKYDLDTYFYYYYSKINSESGVYYDNNLNRRYNQILNNNYNISKNAIVNISGQYKINDSSSIDTGVRVANITGENKQVFNTVSSLFNFRETVYAHFLEWSGKWNKVNIKVGNRIEYFDRDIGYNQSNNYKQYQFDFFPSVYFGYDIDKKNSLSFSASKKIERVSFRNILPYSYYISFNEKFLGNPNLQNQIRYNLEIDYSYNKNIFFTIFYNYIKNNNSNITYVDGQEITHTSQNYDLYNMGIDITYAKSLKKWWYANVKMSLFNEKNKGTVQNLSFNNRNLNIKYTISSVFKFGKWGSLILQNTYASPSYEDLYKIKTGVRLDMKYTNKLMKDRLTFSITVRDILGTYYNRTESINQVYYSMNDRDFGWKQYVFGISYVFDKGTNNSGKKENIDYSETQRTKYE